MMKKNFDTKRQLKFNSLDQSIIKKVNCSKCLDKNVLHANTIFKKY